MSGCAVVVGVELVLELELERELESWSGRDHLDGRAS